MPQFDPAVWSSQIIWLVISFIALYFLMARVAIPRISDVLEEREFKINDSLRKAEGLKHDAEDAVAAYEKIMADARAKAQDEVRQVREQAAKEASERLAELNERMQGQVTAAEARIAEAQAQAIEGLRDMAIDVAGLATERLIGESIAKKDITAAVDGAMKELRR